MKAKAIFTLVAYSLQACGTVEFSGDTPVNPGSPSVVTSRDSSTQEIDGNLPPEDPASAKNIANQQSENALAQKPNNGNSGGNGSGLNENVDFGDGTVFRIGDGVVRQTECLEGVSAYKDSYKRFRFAFDVVNSGTTVQLELQKLCGIDTSTNFATLKLASGAELQKNALGSGQSTINFQPLTLSPGRYYVDVSSEMIPDGRWKGQFDDFIVGSVKLKADKKIVPGTVEALNN